MNISKRWLNEFVEVNDMQDLSNKFNLMSQENTYYKLVDASKIVVGHVLTKVKHPDAEKLNVLTVNVGTEVLQIVCGAPNVEAGQKVIISLVGAVLPGNFKIKESKIRGVSSYGMCCSLTELGIPHSLHGEDGIHVLPEEAIPGEDALKYLGLDDEIIDLDLTPNRGDLLSVMGAAYDTAAILNKPIKLKEIKLHEKAEINPITIKVESDKCLAYHARVIKNVTIKESPEWLKVRLMAVGVRPINNVVDITNYILMECGQPLHSFDYDKFGSNEVLVRNAYDGEETYTLDEQKRLLSSEDLVITNGKDVCCIAGVMGGLDSSVTNETKNILLESAVFNAVSVRKTASRLNLRSESSMRFEKGIDAARSTYALDLACQMLEELAGGEVLTGTSSYQSLDLSDKEISITTDYLSKKIGITVEKSSVIEVFERLGFTVKENGNELKVYVPVRRNDITIKQDLLEEYVRIYGFDKIPSTLVKTDMPGGLSKEQKEERKIKRILTSIGLDEVITYTLISEKALNDFTINPKEPVKLMSPLSEDRAVLRQTPLNGIVEAMSYNTNRKMSDLHLFEISKVYAKDSEEKVLAMGFSGIQNETLHAGKAEVVDFYYVKGLVNRLAKEFGVKLDYYKPETTNPNFNINQTAYIKCDDKLVGFIASLHPKALKERDLKETFVAEINLACLTDNRTIRYEEISKFPSVTRDLTVVVDRKLEALNIINNIKEAGKKMLTNVVVFDVYTGDKIEENLKAVSLKLTFADKEKTLEVEEVNQRVEKILKHLETIGAKLR